MGGIVTVLAWLCLAGGAYAQTYARECQRLAAESIDTSGQKVTDSDAICQKRVCGALPPAPLDFRERLSPQCRLLMAQYRSIWSHEGVSNMLTPSPCSTQQWVVGPTGPFLVSNEQRPVATFAMCTIPKVACTNFRKLLNTIIRHPEPMPTDAFEQFQNPHIWQYPSVFAYEPPALNTTRAQSQAASTDWQPPVNEAGSSDGLRLPADMQSFIVGRNPYIKVLSGYLDKMVDNPKRNDQWTYKNVNKHLGVASGTTWPNDVAGFQAFVKKLSAKGVDRVDGHFRRSSTSCWKGFKLDYYLRLEDMQQWFPCWMHGLGLREFTETGWADSSHGRIHVGRGEHKITDTETPNHTPRTVRSKIFGTGKPRTTAAQVRKLWSPWTSPGALRKLASTPWHDDPHSAAGSAHDGIKEAVDASVRGLEAEEGGQLDVSDALLSDSDWDDGIFDDEVAGLHHTRRNLLSKVTKTVRGDKCWWSPKGTSCEDYYASFTLPDGSVVPGGQSSIEPESNSRGRKTDRHDQNAAGKWLQYYDQSTADLVFDMYTEDFRIFRYERFIESDAS